MKFKQWQRVKWFPRLLTMPVPEPVQQASRILAMQRNIVLPARAMVTAAVFYYLFYKRWMSNPETPREVVLEVLQWYFIFYILFNAVTAALLVLKRFPAGLVQWVVFTVGLVDGLLLAGLTTETGGFSSPLYWVFPGLIMLNALSIPLATPQIVLNLSLSVFYLGAGLVNISVGESDYSRLEPPPRRPALAPLSASDITDIDSFATRLSQPSTNDGVSQYVAEHLSAETRSLLSNYTRGTNAPLQRALAADLNRIVQAGPIYDPNRFANVKLSAATSNLLNQKLQGSNEVRVNRILLLAAYPEELSQSRRIRESFMSRSAAEEPPIAEGGSEPFVLRLIILWLMTASCYGVQLLSFRDRLAQEESRKSSARNDELKAAGRLAAEIAHQLKNPLGIINNAAFSLQRGIREGRNDFSLQIEIIREEIERSDRILTQLMGYAQLSEGRVEKLNLGEELDRAIAEVLPAGANYAIKIQRNYEANLPAVLMQRSHLSVVLVNLLQNAREASHGRGNITLSAHCPGESFVEVSIGDDGPGIAADKLDKIFEPYFTSKKRGTGLGLAIVKHNVELYGGTVRVESELGKGARFILLFPAKTFIRAVS
jgi:signal transduction histidine kinase